MPALPRPCIWRTGTRISWYTCLCAQSVVEHSESGFPPKNERRNSEISRSELSFSHRRKGRHNPRFKITAGLLARRAHSQIPLLLDFPSERYSPERAGNTQCKFPRYVERSDKQYLAIRCPVVPVPTSERPCSCPGPDPHQNENLRECHEILLGSPPKSRRKGRFPSLAS